MDEQKEVMTEVLENADDAVDVIDLPPVEESSGIEIIQSDLCIMVFQKDKSNSHKNQRL